jgi:hypothetical protein
MEMRKIRINNFFVSNSPAAAATAATAVAARSKILRVNKIKKCQFICARTNNN